MDDFSKICTNNYDDFNKTSIEKCLSEYLNQFRKTVQYEQCSEFCPLECDSMNYLVTPYSEPSPVSGNISEKNKKYNYFSTKFNTYEEFGKHYVEIYVYYKDLKYTVISEELKTEPFNLICFRD